MERPSNAGMLNFLRMSYLLAFSHGADVAVRYDAVEGNTVAVVPLHEFQAPSGEVAQPPVPKLGVGHRVHHQLGGAIGISTQVKHQRIQVALLFA